MHFEGHNGQFTNNYFHDAKLQRAFAFGPGDGKTHRYIVEDNTFEDCNFGAPPSDQLFQFSGGTAGSVIISNNTIANCGGVMFTTTPTARDPVNRNVHFINNDITSNGGAVFSFFTGTEDIIIRGNTVRQADDRAMTAAFWGGKSKENTVVEANTFIGGRTPEQTFDMAPDAVRPLFHNNRYVQMQSRLKGRDDMTWVTTTRW